MMATKHPDCSCGVGMMVIRILTTKANYKRFFCACHIRGDHEGHFMWVDTWAACRVDLLRRAISSTTLPTSYPHPYVGSSCDHFTTQITIVPTSTGATTSSALTSLVMNTTTTNLAHVVMLGVYGCCIVLVHEILVLMLGIMVKILSS
ncbi:hypothetical protein Pfo_010073 [Paulownia fortunei]|nr:hypothetical protein Pfo_010073 [Paulownia fortunei]